VFLVDWGVPDEEDADMGLGEFVCDELHWAVRETLRAAGEEELTCWAGVSVARCARCTARCTR
jgi:poly(3-hydroxyalkanoate) synthetase